MRVILGAVLILFAVYTGWIAIEFGYTSVFEVCLREPPSTQALVDLWISCGLLLLLMVFDNKKNGRPFRLVAPFVVITLVAGAIGPLAYYFVYSDSLKQQS